VKGTELGEKSEGEERKAIEWKRHLFESSRKKKTAKLRRHKKGEGGAKKKAERDVCLFRKKTFSEVDGYEKGKRSL